MFHEEGRKGKGTPRIYHLLFRGSHLCLLNTTNCFSSSSSSTRFYPGEAGEDPPTASEGSRQQPGCVWIGYICSRGFPELDSHSLILTFLSNVLISGAGPSSAATALGWDNHRINQLGKEL